LQRIQPYFAERAVELKVPLDGAEEEDERVASAPSKNQLRVKKVLGVSSDSGIYDGDGSDEGIGGDEDGGGDGEEVG
jgi:hypothetical protein